jgi:hypothetical protein
MASEAQEGGAADPGASETLTRTTPPPFRRGIAFVHGIGQQKQCESLRLFSEAVGAWLEQWLTRKPDTDLRVTCAELVERSGPPVGAAISETMTTDPHDAAAPAHTVLTICRQGAPDERVLIAECWWADAFEPPKLSELVIWLTLIAPYLVMSHAAAPLRRSWRRLHLGLGWVRGLFICLRMIPQAGFFLTSVALIPVLVGLLTIILLPALLPISSVQEAARRAATVVVGYLGDTFIITVSPIRRDLITSAVQADFDWLSAQCEKIAIVAHSQGVVLAHDALQRRRLPNLTRFVTLGSGLEKLLRLRLLFRNDRGVFAKQWVGVAAAAVFTATTIAVPSAIATGHQVESLVLPLVAGGAAVVVGFGYVFAFDRVKGYEDAVRIRGAGTQFRWFNFYASSDPVPNGPMLDETRPWIRESEVFNYASIVRDHTSYLKNRDEVLPILARVLFGAMTFRQSADRLAAKRARTRRRMRTRLLTVGRSLIAASGAAATIAVWGQLDSFGHSVRRHLPAVAVGLARHVFAALPRSLNTPQGRGAIVWISAWLVAYGFFALLLSLWGRLDLRLLISRNPQGWLRKALRALCPGVACAVVVTVVATALADGISGSFLVGLHMAWPILVAFCLLAVVIALSEGDAWLTSLEIWLSRYWLKKAQEEEYRPLAGPSAVRAFVRQKMIGGFGAHGPAGP